MFMNTQEKLKHLYWRAGFGWSPKEWQTIKHFPTHQAIDQLFTEAHQKSKKNIRGTGINISMADLKNISEEEKKKLKKEGRLKLGEHNVNWLLRMGDPDESALLEKMCLFWHGHFACVTKFPNLAEAQLNTIRQNALGNFRELVLAIAKDVSMIRFLNNQQNRKQSPNENFARELIELFTIGRGNYSENDIKEAARAFTGWSSNLKGEFVFRKWQHDFGQKIFFVQKGNWDGTDIIDMILEKKETAEFIARKAYQYFVNENVDEQKVQHLANIFYRSDYDIEKLMRAIFESDWFYDKKNVGTKIKSPIELMAGMVRTLDVKFKNPLGVIFMQKALGQMLFNPPNVAGWAGGKAWIDNSTLLLRLNLAGILFQNAELNMRIKDEFEDKTRGNRRKHVQAEINFSSFYQMFAKDNERELLEKMTGYLLQPKLDNSQNLFNGNVIKSNKEDFIKTLCLRIMTLPEYQLC